MLSVSVRSLSATFCLNDSTLESSDTLSSNTSPDRGQILTLIVSPMMLSLDIKRVKSITKIFYENQGL